MEQGPWEANRFSASQGISHVLWNPKVYYRVYSSPPPVPILSHINPVHAPPYPTSWRYLIIILSTLEFSKWSLSVRISHQNAVYTSPFPHTCYMPRPSNCWFDHSFRYSFVHFLVISSLLGPKILHRTLFSDTLSLHPSLNVSDQVSHPCKTTGKIINLYIS